MAVGAQKSIFDNPWDELPESKNKGLEAYKTQTSWTDPCAWIEDQLGVDLFSNQIDIIEALRSPDNDGFNSLGARGCGKTQSLAWGLDELAINRPGTGIILAAPIEKQAGKIIRYMREAMEGNKSKCKEAFDKHGSSAFRLQFKNGSWAQALSGQERANVESEHGHVLVIDEAHLVSSYSVTNKLIPMLSMPGGFSKLIKLGTAIGRSHFYKSCMAKGSTTLVCPWDKAEIFLLEPKPFFYRGKQYPRKMLARMPLPLRMQMFPDVPKLHEATGNEITEMDWATQYAMEWVADINNVLSDEDQERLANGKHVPLTQGRNGDTYFAGLDTAYSDRAGADSTKLCIWHLRKDGMLEKVASYAWQGKVLVQEQEIWDIINPKTGLFKVESCMADNSNIAIDIIQRFRAKGVPIVGIPFGGAAPKTIGNKNWKNTIFDHFIVRLQTGELSYPNVKQMKLDRMKSDPEMQTQIDGLLEDLSQWFYLQRTRGRGLNDTIEAPKNQMEDDEDGKSVAIHDDACSADALGTFAARHRDFIRKEMASGGTGIIYDIPIPVIGRRTTTGTGQGYSENPFSAGYQNPAGSRANTGYEAPPGSGDGQIVDIGAMIGLNKKRR